MPIPRFWSGTIANQDISPNADISGAKLANTSVPTAKLASPNSYFTTALHCSRQLTASVTSLFRFQMPFAATLVEVCAAARASGGTSPTLSIDVLEGGVSVLSSPISVTAGASAVASPSDPSIANDAQITVGATIGGTNPTWDDVTLLLTFKTPHTA